jgi:hypothetical protein
MQTAVARKAADKVIRGQSFNASQLLRRETPL